jgi:hypothetical protein
VRLAVRVGATLNLVTALAAGEGLVLVLGPIFGMGSAPGYGHRYPAFWTTGSIVRAELACDLRHLDSKILKTLVSE